MQGTREGESPPSRRDWRCIRSRRAHEAPSREVRSSGAREGDKERKGQRSGRRKVTTHCPVSRRPAQPRVPCPRRSARPRSPTWPGSAAAGRAAPGSRQRVRPPGCCAPAKEQRRRTLLPGPAPRPTPPQQPRPQPAPSARSPRSAPAYTSAHLAVQAPCHL